MLNDAALKKGGPPNLPSLQPDRADRAAAVLRGLVNAVPFLGGALAELVTEVIPAQRTDRLAVYIEELGKRLEQMELPHLGPQLHEPANVDLFEDGAAQAIRAMSEGRRKYIVGAVANGIAAEDKRKLQHKRLLSMLAEIDDEELVLLLAHQSRSAELFEKLRPSQDPAFEDERAMWGAMHNKLEKLHLLEWKGDTKEIDIHPGRVGSRPETVRIPQDSGDWVITHLGHLLLASIGFKAEAQPNLDEFPVSEPQS